MEYLTRNDDRFAGRIGRFIAIGSIICVFYLGASANRPLLDFTGDVRTDFTNITNPATAGSHITWSTLRNPAFPGPTNSFITIMDWGLTGDSITPGDYDGNGKSELSIWRSGVYYELPFPDVVGSPSYLRWGQDTAENPGRTGDYDGDGKDDHTLIRVTNNQLVWYIKGSAGTNYATPFGRIISPFSTFVFPGADFNGDGRDDLVMCYINTTTGANTWWVGDSITGAAILTEKWGDYLTDFFVSPGDYNGDGKADLVVYRAGGNGTWWIRNTATGTPLPVVQFGRADPSFVNADIPLRGDYDGDGIRDIAVYRPSTAEYWWINSSNPNTFGYQQWGNPGNPDEVPLASLYVY
ncbi:hypothetical protein BH10ACI3_BH10ACI3_26260 [soil metagenome]